MSATARALPIEDDDERLSPDAPAMRSLRVVPAAEPIEPTSRHIQQARTLVAGGWSRTAVAALLRSQGVKTTRHQVGRWVDPGMAERARLAERARGRAKKAKKAGGRLTSGPRRTGRFRWERLQALRALGVPCSAIATVMTFDFPDTPLTTLQVEYAVKHDAMPVCYRRLDRQRDVRAT